MTALQLLAIVECPARIGESAGWDKKPQVRTARRSRFCHIPGHRPRMAMSEIDRRIERLHDHLHREDISPVIVAESLHDLLAHPMKMTQAELALRLDKSEVWMCDMLAILRLSPALLERVRTSELAIPADALTRIARLGDPAREERLVDLLLKGASVAEIKRRIKTLRRGRKTPIPKRVFDSLNGYHMVITKSRKGFCTLGILHAAEELVEKLRVEVENEAKNPAKATPKPRLVRFKANGKPVSVAQETVDGDIDSGGQARGESRKQPCMT